VTPFIADRDFSLYVGDVRAVLAELEDESVHCVVTSPPYWGLRDYGTGSWAGGNENCDHKTRPEYGRAGKTFKDYGAEAGYAPGSNFANHKALDQGESYKETCGKCGATRTDQQLGLEKTPDEYVENMVAVFRQVRRVLRRDGTCWLNIGDSYNAGTSSDRINHTTKDPNDTRAKQFAERSSGRARMDVSGLKPKDLVGIPWRLAFALQQDGWYLRAEIVWAKPNPMPESVTDRPTKSHEQVFLLTRSPRYFYDADAVREPHTRLWDSTNGGSFAGSDWAAKASPTTGGRQSGVATPPLPNPAGRNLRSVWSIATEPFAEAHFATFPQALVEPCVKAGTSERGCCSVCGAPWERETEREPMEIRRSGVSPYDHHSTRASGKMVKPATSETTGWKPTCACTNVGVGVGGHTFSAPAPVPCTVLDPFMGSGTVALVSRKLGRRSIGIELNQAYAELAARRLSQQSLFATVPP